MFSLKAQILNGKLETDFNHIYDWSATQKDGMYLIMIEPLKEKRTLKQLRYWWGIVLVAFMEHQGYDKHDIPKHRKVCHDSLKAIFEPPEMIENKITGKFEANLWSMGDCTLKKLRDFLDWFERYSAQEYGFVMEENNN